MTAARAGDGLFPEDVPPPGDATFEDRLRDEILLALVPGIGPRLREALIERFGEVSEILRAAPSELRTVSGIGPKLAARICQARGELDPEAELAVCREHDIAILLRDTPAYPRLLGEIPDPPPLLFVRGAIFPQDAMAVAIVGTRHATPYGLRQAERLGQSLARAGLTVVSGLARGVDAAAHRGALLAGGRTIAVLGSGVLEIYPPEHKQLADEIAVQGAVVSESPPRTTPQAGLFPQRNRIISGMSLGTVIIEAGDRSGALITARLANEQGREVFALPGPVDSRASRGCHRLIRDGAALLETADDVLETLGPLVAPVAHAQGGEVHHPAELLLNEIERRVLDAVSNDGAQVDAIVAATQLPVSQVLATLSVLEMRRLIRRKSGNVVVRV